MAEISGIVFVAELMQFVYGMVKTNHFMYGMFVCSLMPLEKFLFDLPTHPIVSLLQFSDFSSSFCSINRVVLFL